MGKINTVIFDLDGTLLDTLEDLTDSLNFVLSHYRYPPRSIDEVRSFVGNGVKRLVELAIPNGVDNPHFADCVQLFKDYYAQHMDNKTRPYDGIMDLLQALRQNNYQTAIISNKFDQAVKALSKFYFGDYIVLAIGESEHIRRKPAPDCVYAVLRELGKVATEAIYVGDSEVDVKTAQNAGLLCVGVTWGFRSREVLFDAGADFIIDHPRELLELLNR